MVQKMTLRIGEDTASVIDGSNLYTDSLTNFEADFSVTIPSLDADVYLVQYIYGDSAGTQYHNSSIGQEPFTDWTQTEMEAIIDGVGTARSAQAVRNDTAALQNVQDLAAHMDYFRASNYADLDNFTSLFDDYWDNADASSPNLPGLVLSFFQLSSYDQQFYDLCGQFGAAISGSTVAGDLVGNPAAQTAVLCAGMLFMMYHTSTVLSMLDLAVRGNSYIDDGVPTPLPTL